MRIYLNLFLGLSYIFGEIYISLANKLYYGSRLSNNTNLAQIFSEGDPDANPQPLIGILSQPLYHSLPNVSFIAASYVQFVEAAGARAVPIIYNQPVNEILEVFSQVSGIILPGGTVG